MPLLFVDSCRSTALILGVSVPGVGGQSFNVVDDDVLTQREYLELLQRTNRAPQVIRMPRLACYALGFHQEVASAARANLRQRNVTDQEPGRGGAGEVG